MTESTQSFFEQPILNSPYEYPARHWVLDESGQPTGKIQDSRRRSEYITPIPKPQKRKGAGKQAEIAFLTDTTAVRAGQDYDPLSIINEVRHAVDTWRKLQNQADWLVTPETAQLLEYWRHHRFESIRPFFCQVEAIETLIWLLEVAPKIKQKDNTATHVWNHLRNANAEANPELMRIALKLATGAGKTTVMAMIIAWQTVNAVRRPASKSWTRGFLIVAPGITIKDRLRVLQPNDPDNYYWHRELVPTDMRRDLEQAKIVITNYHAFQLREKLKLAKGGRELLQGRGPEIKTKETAGEMIRRSMSALMGLKDIMVINDEAHHCYREKPNTDETSSLKGEDKDEAKKNNEAARVWISGLETIQQKLGIKTVVDLSATPFFLKGSGYNEGSLFHWTVSDFSLMDAIECGIVKLPRVPIAGNVPGADMPVLRNLWEYIGKAMPKKGRSRSKGLDPLSLPVQLQTALDVLYGHYEKTYQAWLEAQLDVPPVFIVVANNTSSSKLIADYIAGFQAEKDDGSSVFHQGRFELFRNYDDQGQRLARPRTLLIDSEQLESGDALSKDFKEIAAAELETFRQEIAQRDGAVAAEKVSEQQILREVMNTVGKKDRLGESIRCVVSVSMLTEGWDANTVTHILGVRAFGTQLLCEQVVGRALRRQSYDLDENGLFPVEYADILGVPFDFAASPVTSKPVKPRKTVEVLALNDREHLEISFPRVTGYRVALPETRLEAKFTADTRLVLTPALVGPSKTLISGIVGQRETLDLAHLAAVRPATIAMHLTRHLLFHQFRDAGDEPKLHLFGQLKQITTDWMKHCLECNGDTFPAQLLYSETADLAAQRIKAAINEGTAGKKQIHALLDSYNPEASTRYVYFRTSKSELWTTQANRCHVNYVVYDSEWEAEFCRVVEAHPNVRAYVKNHGLGLEVPYQLGPRKRRYLPDFIVILQKEDREPIHLIVEIKGFRGEDAIEKANTMRHYWIPGVNQLGRFGQWAFAELTDVYKIDSEFKKLVAELLKG
ncbi:MAG: DEAD/DEAH box helicase family protein [Leptospiraceae bacterium]|nr:DEAD/DEAH box helicase family protein [Leptospiraceae bacterium]